MRILFVLCEQTRLPSPLALSDFFTVFSLLSLRLHSHLYLDLTFLSFSFDLFGALLYFVLVGIIGSVELLYSRYFLYYHLALSDLVSPF